MKYECIQCDYRATKQSHLTHHIQSVHDGVKYDCNQCDYRATTQGSLTCHIRWVHEGVKYDCNQCDYRATTQGSLTYHIQSVLEGVKYNCNQCDYRATMQSNLTCHIVTIWIICIMWYYMVLYGTLWYNMCRGGYRPLNISKLKWKCDFLKTLKNYCFWRFNE